MRVIIFISLFFLAPAVLAEQIIASGPDYGFAHVRRAPNGDIWVTYSIIPDNGVIHAYPDRYKVSKDNGETWSEEKLFPFAAHPSGRNHATFESFEGCMYALDRMALLYNPRDLYQGRMYKSCDDGETWQNELIIIEMGFGVQEFGVLDYTIQDGKLLALAAIYRDGIWMRSLLRYEILEGDTVGRWKMLGEFVAVPDVGHFTYSTIEVTQDGSLLIILCPEGMQGLYESRSFDGGATWTTPQLAEGILPIIPQWSYGSYQNPDLVLLDNGVMALCYGRPGVGMAVSLDGSGLWWDQQIRILRGYNDATSAPSPDGMNRGTSTGNGQCIALTEDTVLIAYDKKRTMPNGDHAILVDKAVIRTTLEHD